MANEKLTTETLRIARRLSEAEKKVSFISLENSLRRIKKLARRDNQISIFTNARGFDFSRYWNKEIDQEIFNINTSLGYFNSLKEIILEGHTTDYNLTGLRDTLRRFRSEFQDYMVYDEKFRNSVMARIQPNGSFCTELIRFIYYGETENKQHQGYDLKY